MKKVAVLIIAGAVAIFSIPTAAAQISPTGTTVVTEESSNDVESANMPGYGVVRERPGRDPKVPGEPVPVAPPTTFPGTASFELVGVTTRYFSGDRGVLNYTMACQAEFEGSRMCAVSELLSTLNVPRDMRDVTAWIRPDDTAPVIQLDGRRRIAESEVKDCSGWTSASPDTIGLALAIDPICFGGVVERSCSSQLAVACCAPMPRE